jgi:hypothetical protein
MARLQLYALIAAGFVLVLLGIYSAGIMRGQDKVKRKLDEDRLKNLKTHKEITDEINQLDDPYLVDRATRWVRKDKRE